MVRYALEIGLEEGAEVELFIVSGGGLMIDLAFLPFLTTISVIANVLTVIVGATGMAFFLHKIFCKHGEFSWGQLR